MSGIEFPMEGFLLERATDGDMGYFVSCVKSDILASVTEKEKELSDTWIDDPIAIAKFGFVKKPMLDDIYILRKDGINIGMIWLGVSRDQFTMDPVGYVLGIFVDEKYRRKGLGTALMRFAEQWTEEKNLVMLSLNVGELNASAVKFYESMGYSVQTRVMRKSLR